MFVCLKSSSVVNTPFAFARRITALSYSIDLNKRMFVRHAFKIFSQRCQHMVSAGSIDLYLSGMWLEPKTGLSRAMPCLGHRASPAQPKLRLVVLGKAVSALLCELSPPLV